MTGSRRVLLIAVGTVLLAAIVIIAVLRPTHAAPRHVALRVVRPDGQPLPPEESGDHEIVLASGCGVERWPVKTGTDADRGNVSSTVHSTSIQSLSSRPKPSHYPTNNRVAPSEFYVWQLAARVTQYKEEADSDIHLVLRDSANRSMIAEIPAPSCVGSSSRWKAGISGARSTWTHTYPLSTSWHHINRAVTIRGLGFFDPPHGQAGASSNGIELHPVIRVQLR
jgi:hypothetical protein